MPFLQRPPFFVTPHKLQKARARELYSNPFSTVTCAKVRLINLFIKSCAISARGFFLADVLCLCGYSLSIMINGFL